MVRHHYTMKNSIAKARQLPFHEQIGLRTIRWWKERQGVRPGSAPYPADEGNRRGNEEARPMRLSPPSAGHWSMQMARNGFASGTGACYTGNRVRGVAQPGSALEWGSSGRTFKSSRPDQERLVLTGPAVSFCDASCTPPRCLGCYPARGWSAPAPHPPRLFFRARRG